MYLTAAFGGRARLGEEPWLGDDAADEELARVVDEAVAGCEDDVEVWACFTGICGARAGSGGASGDADRPLRLPRALNGSGSEARGIVGGEYCVPASTVRFGGEYVDLIEGECTRLLDV